MQYTEESSSTSTSVSGDHIKGKSNDDVHKFAINGTKLPKFPKNLENIFKNLESIEIHAADFAILEVEDLKPFMGKLKSFNFTDNKLEVIEADLFAFNPNLEAINFNGNHIKYVGNGAFDGLKKLKSLKFKNPCYSGSASNHSEVVKLIVEIKSKCIDLDAYEKYKILLASSSESLKSGKFNAILSLFVTISYFMYKM